MELHDIINFFVLATFKKYQFVLVLCVYCLCVCLCTMCRLCSGSQRRVLEPLDLELHMPYRHHVSAENLSWVLFPSLQPQ